MKLTYKLDRAARKMIKLRLRVAQK